MKQGEFSRFMCPLHAITIHVSQRYKSHSGIIFLFLAALPKHLKWRLLMATLRVSPHIACTVYSMHNATCQTTSHTLGESLCMFVYVCVWVLSFTSDGNLILYYYDLFWLLCIINVLILLTMHIQQKQKNNNFIITKIYAFQRDFPLMQPFSCSTLKVR